MSNALSIVQPRLIDPLPLEVAKAWGFKLSHFVRYDGVFLYSLRDWLAGCVDDAYAGKAIDNLRQDNTFSYSKGESQEHLVVDEASEGGRPRKELYVIDRVLYRLTQDIRSTAKRKTSTAVDAIKDYLAQAGAFVDRQRIKADEKRSQDATAYQLRGRTASWAGRRLNVRDTVKALNSHIDRVCDDKYAHSAVIDQEYIELVGKTTRQLKTMLQTDKVRDVLPELTLTYIETAEESLTAVLARRDKMTTPQLRSIVIRIVRPLGELLQMVCHEMGIDPIVDDNLLPQAKQTKLIEGK